MHLHNAVKTIIDEDHGQLRVWLQVAVVHLALDCIVEDLDGVVCKHARGSCTHKFAKTERNTCDCIMRVRRAARCRKMQTRACICSASQKNGK